MNSLDLSFPQVVTFQRPQGEAVEKPWKIMVGAVVSGVDGRTVFMANFLLHALWLPGTGLNLWVEQVEGRKIVLPSAVPTGTFPPVIERFLEDKKFRHRARVELRTPKGKAVELTIPTLALGPTQTVEFLQEIAYLDSSQAAVRSAQREAVAEDLYWILRMFSGLNKFVRAGRVTIAAAFDAGQWWPRWVLASGIEESGWISEMIAAAPGIISVNNPTVREDITEALTHWIASSYLQDVMDEQRPYPWHDFAQSLITSSPLRRGGPALVRALAQWRKSITEVDVQLVFIIEEPPAEEEESFGIDGEASSRHLESVQQTDNAIWPVRLQVRSGTGSPQPIRFAGLDRSTMEILRTKQREAIEITPMVDMALHPMGPAIASRPKTGREGDWDVYLSTEEIVAFVGEGVDKLRRRGFTVMLPRAWQVADTSARIVTRSVDTEPTGPSKLGMDELVQYDWRVSVGDIELTEEEMTELASSKSGLINLRGEWVLADNSALNKVENYMQELTQSTRKRRLAAVESAQALAAAARAQDHPNAQALEEQAVALAEKFEEDFGAEASTLAMSGTASVQELRDVSLRSLLDQPVEFTGSTWHNSLIGGLSGTPAPAPQRVEIPDSIVADLRDYQRRGVDWLYWMSRNNLGAILADDMGLGKTVQLLSLVAIEKERGEATGPTLVVAPTSVVGNWAAEVAKFTPGLKVMVHHGTERLHGELLEEKIADTDLVITSYGVVARDHLELSKTTWDHVVLDEAQAIKNSSTRASKAVRALPVRQRIALTGTPVENRLSEMRSILDFVNPGILGSATFFRNHFAKAIERDNDSEMAQRLRSLTAPFILRRLKTDETIIDDLPDKNEHIIRVNMTAEQAALYKALTDQVQQQLAVRSGIQRRGLVLAMITRIKQICNHPAHYLGDGSSITERGRHRSGKVEALMELIDTAIETDQRMLVFTQYRAFGSILQPYLEQRLGEDVPFLHGGVSKTARDKMVARFQQDDGPRVMILSLKAGGTGLNLTAASMVVHMDRWWNPAVENQATDRAFRIGQQRNVNVYKMITSGTLEESIQDILDGKTQLAGAIIGEGEGWITELSPEQLAQLISYRDKEDGVQ